MHGTHNRFIIVYLILFRSDKTYHDAFLASRKIKYICYKRKL